MKKLGHVLFLSCVLSTSTFVSSQPSSVDSNGISEDKQRAIFVQEQKQEAVEQLRDIEQSLHLKVKQRRDLALEIKQAGNSASEAKARELDELDSEIELLNKTFEQIAIGGIDLSIFGVEQEKFNWREELILIVKPLIENVKGLTEKPRKIESLKRIIADKQIAKEASEDALASIKTLKAEAETKLVSNKLATFESEWLGRLEDIARESQLAQYQLDSLEGKDVPWFEILKQGTLTFISGRGLTIILMISAAFAVWGLMRGLLWIVRLRSSSSQDRSVKIRYRLASYGYRLLTAVLIAIAIMMVLYLRRDLLLLAIVVIIFIGAALALKNLLPKYITESRLLLNMGGVRERERVMFNGVPWEVSAINMFSRLTNPEIRGAIRLPIGHMHEMISRPAFDEPWFPSSEGDWILDHDGDPVEVVRQTPDTVELRDLNAVTRHVATAEYYSSGYQNVTRAEVFRIAVTFGIDYSTQAEDMDVIETAFEKSVRKEFEQCDFSEHVMDVNVDFHSAGDSSLNYIMLTKFDSQAAGAYNRIKRRINRACVKVCTENDWTIPFPQMSVHIESETEKHESTNKSEDQ